MFKFPKISIKDILPVDEIKQFLNKERLSSVLRKENYSSDTVLEALKSDGYAITYICLFVGTVVAIVFLRSHGVGLGTSITLSSFVYFNAFLIVYLMRHRHQINWNVAGWSCLAVFLVAIGIFILIGAAFVSWDAFLSSTLTIGLMAFPVMAFDRTFRQRVIGGCFSTFFNTLESSLRGGSTDSIFSGLLGTALLGLCLIMVMLAGGALGAVVFYVCTVIELLTLSDKFARDEVEDVQEEEEQKLPDGCIDGDAALQADNVTENAASQDHEMVGAQAQTDAAPRGNGLDDTIFLD